MRARLARLQATARDTWQRLKPWVRYALIAAAAALALLLLVWVAVPKAPPPAPQVVSIPVSVRLPPRPPAAVEPAAVPGAETPAAPAIDNSAALRELLNTKLVLKLAPYAELLTAVQDGMMPRIADNGMTPLRAYARPAGTVPDNAGKIAIVLLEGGLSERMTAQALAQAPQQVSIAFDLYAPNLPDQINAARAAGHEALLDLPMEPETYPIDDPGPETLLTQSAPDDNLKLLRAFMVRAPGVFAFASSSGRQFVTEAAALQPLLQELKRRGLGWVDLTLRAGSATPSVAGALQLPVASGQIVLDDILTRDHLQAQLASAVTQAKTNGQAVIVARMYPLTLDTLAAFAATLPDQNIALVPVSALLSVPPAATPVQQPAAPTVTTAPHHD